MAGGKGSRLGLAVEKPLLRVGERPMVAHVIDALKRCPSIRKVCVAVSPHTPGTKAYALSFDAVSVIETPGLDYHSDMRYAIKAIGEGRFVVVSADLPLLKPRTIECVVNAYRARRKPSLAAIAPLRSFQEMGLSPTCTIEVGRRKYVPCGINVIDGKAIDMPYIDESYFVVDDPAACINVNNLLELSVAEKMINYRTDKPSC